MTPIEISNHPEIPSIKRKVTDYEVDIKNFRKKIVLTLKVEHYKEENEVDVKLNTINNIFPTLTIDESTQVDAQGNIVQGQGVMNEYEFYKSLENSPIIILDLVESKVAWADSLGRLNIY